MKACLTVLLLMLAILMPVAAGATNLPPSPYCEITGEIVKIEGRQEKSASPMAPETTVDYTDVTVRVESVRPFRFQLSAGMASPVSCALENLPREIVYQSCDSDIDEAWTETPIWAITHQQGDEFWAGNCLLSVINRSGLSDPDGGKQ